MRLRQAHDTRSGPHRPGTCGACDRERAALEDVKPNPEDDTCRTGENAALWVGLLALFLIAAVLAVVVLS